MYQYWVILSLGHNSFIKINEKKMEKKINNDLAIMASQMPEGWFMTKFSFP